MSARYIVAWTERGWFGWPRKRWLGFDSEGDARKFHEAVVGFKDTIKATVAGPLDDAPQEPGPTGREVAARYFQEAVDRQVEAMQQYGRALVQMEAAHRYRHPHDPRLEAIERRLADLEHEAERRASYESEQRGQGL